MKFCNLIGQSQVILLKYRTSNCYFFYICEKKYKNTETCLVQYMSFVCVITWYTV